MKFAMRTYKKTIEMAKDILNSACEVRGVVGELDPKVDEVYDDGQRFVRQGGQFRPGRKCTSRRVRLATASTFQSGFPLSIPSPISIASLAAPLPAFARS